MKPGAGHSAASEEAGRIFRQRAEEEITFFSTAKTDRDPVQGSGPFSIAGTRTSKKTGNTKNIRLTHAEDNGDTRSTGK